METPTYSELWADYEKLEAEHEKLKIKFDASQKRVEQLKRELERK